MLKARRVSINSSTKRDGDREVGSKIAQPYGDELLD
jgi:hypothetical protein